MARASKADPVAFPVRGVPGGWRDPWDDPDLDPERLRLGAAERARQAEERAATIRAAGDGA